eukprot:scaffold805_cov165-Amphora_coffeaeformis.AAC.5
MAMMVSYHRGRFAWWLGKSDEYSDGSCRHRSHTPPPIITFSFWASSQPVQGEAQNTYVTITAKLAVLRTIEPQRE